MWRVTWLHVGVWHVTSSCNYGNCIKKSNYSNVSIIVKLQLQIMKVKANCDTIKIDSNKSLKIFVHPTCFEDHSFLFFRQGAWYYWILNLVFKYSQMGIHPTKRLYIHKCLFVCLTVSQSVTETSQQLEIIILHHSSFIILHSFFIQFATFKLFSLFSLLCISQIH